MLCIIRRRTTQSECLVAMMMNLDNANNCSTAVASAFHFISPQKSVGIFQVVVVLHPLNHNILVVVVIIINNLNQFNTFNYNISTGNFQV